MKRVDMDIRLALQAPYMTQSSAPGAYGIDSVLARDVDGRPYLPGTLITGRLRQAWEELRGALGDDPEEDVPTLAEIDILLGKKPAEGSYEPYAKRLFFGDFTLCGVEPAPRLRNRIQIDSERGAVAKNQLMALDCPFAAGESLQFEGVLRFEAEDNKEMHQIKNQVRCGLQWISQLGAFRGIGFGRLQDVETDAPDCRDFAVTPGQWNGAAGLDLVLKPEAPFCIAGRPTAGNIFESKEEIPGGVIRGCLAKTLDRLAKQPMEDTDGSEKQNRPDFSLLKQHFSKIRITHAFPSSTCFTRPVRPPQSLVKAGGALYDVALLDGPALIQGKAPAFAVDWKEFGDVKAKFGWPRLDRELRVRTAIDRHEMRHEEKALFAYEMIVPGGRCWLARVDVSDIDEKHRGDVLDQLAAILEPGLLGLGKSKVPVTLRVHDRGALKNAHPMDPADSRMGDHGLLILTLQTPALMPDPKPLVKENSSGMLFKAYRDAWKELAPELTLQRFFARQYLSGGRYQHGRFQKGGPYRPWLLTDAGSVFVFSAADWGKVRKTMEDWLAKGLPIAPTVLSAYNLDENVDETWKSCPFIPQNGYGEIAVNLGVHQECRPPAGRYEYITRIEDKEVTCD